MNVVPKIDQPVVGLAPESFVPNTHPDPLAERKHGLIGTQVSRIDGPLKVQGAAQFAAEVQLENLTYGALLYSTIAKGRIASIDTEGAESAPGVVLVMTYKNAPRLKAVPAMMEAEKAASGDDLPVMQDPAIHWNGQPVAVVLAETQEQADHAKSLIKVTYEAEQALTRFTDAVQRKRDDAKFMGEPLRNDVGDAEAALKQSRHKIDVTYRTPRHNHNAIEPHAVTLSWQDGTLLVHDCTQMVAHTAWSLATAFGIDEKQVRVLSPFVGGGFGSKGYWQHQVLAAAAAKLAERPVRLALSREGVYRVVGGRTLTEQRVAIGADDDGRFQALIHTGVTSMTPHNNVPEPFIHSSQHMYASRTLKLGVQVTYMDMLANTFMRAPGEAVGSVGVECGIDELAHEMGIDPIELRLRNEPEKDPTTGQSFSSRQLAKAYRDGAERFGWSRRPTKPGSCREGEWLIGLGVASAYFPYYRMPGGAARIIIANDGHATVEIAAHEMGMGTATATAQIAAERLGLSLDQVTVVYGDSALPGVVMAGGSQQTAAIGGAVIAAHRKLVGELLKLAGNDSPLAGLSVDEVGGFKDGLATLDDAKRHETYASILARAKRDTVSCEADASQPAEMQEWSMHSYGAMFCEARVNTVTGEVRIPRFLGSFDCGRIINAKTAASQFRGGIIMGLGLALMEETNVDERKGRIMNANLADYHVPVHLDVPKIEVMWTDIPDPHSPMGSRGVGEIGITGVGAAVANAIFNATGKRVRDFPITLDKLL